ncbi:MAG: HEAT repeat domain-containing protein [Candidatus Sulfotelmatobacter sp.]
MRKILSITVLICSAIIASLAQQNSPHKAGIDALLPQLRSNDDGLRAQAYERLKSEPGALQSATVKTALLDLLDRENNVHESAMREHVGISDKYGEGYTEYVYALGETVASFVNWNDPREVCMAVRGFVPDDAIANHAIATIPCLLQKARSDLGLVRGRAVAILVQALAKAKNNLEPSTIEAADQVIRGALHDSDAVVRTNTVEALGDYGSEGMIPALQKVAEADPSPHEEYAIRRWAIEAIAAIQKRAHAPN